MQNVNQLVLNVQSEGLESYSFVELFEILTKETIEPKAESFRKQLKGQVEEAISFGYDLIQELVSTWDGTGNFHSLFKVSYTNRLKNHVKFVARDKRKHNMNYDVSLSESVASELSFGMASPILEVTPDKNLHNTVDFTASFDGQPSLEQLIKQFAEKYPEHAGVIEIMGSFSDDTKKSAKTKAFCEYFGVQSYTTVIQKRVSRAREAFKKFLVKHNYELTF